MTLWMVDQLLAALNPDAGVVLASLSLATLAVAVAANGAQAAQRVSEFTLKNGLQVLVIPDHRAPVVTQMIWYKVGAADEPPGSSGIAHFLEHLMFKGTDKIPTGQFSKIVAKNGGEDNAFTNHDVTAYFQRVASDRLPLVMQMEADRMENLRLTEEDVKTERDVILEERRSRVDNDPGSILQEQMMAALYANHPYGIPIIGWEHEIAALNREDALSYYKRFYAPNNAILVIAGDVEPEEVRKLAEETYGKLEPNGALNGRHRPQEPAHFAPVKVTLEDPRAGRTTVQRFYLAPSYASAKPGEAEALDLLMRIAATGSVSKIYKRLVIEDKTGGECRRLVFRFRPRFRQARLLCHRRRERHRRGSRQGDLRRGRGAQAEGRHAGRARPRARLLYRRIRLHVRQPVAHGAPLRLAARHRHERR